MKTVSLILAGVSTLMILSQLICGLWLKSHGAVAESVDFHIQLGIGTVVAVLLTLGLFGIVVIRQ